MARSPFRSERTIDPMGLRIRSFKETNRVRNFSCGNKDLDDFLNTEEVDNYEAQNFGKTYLVFYKGDLVAYFTISFDGLRREYLKTHRSFSKAGEVIIESIPAIKIGRLAVHKDWQHVGIGRTIIQYIAGMALELSRQGGLRLLIVEAKPESKDFYEKCGFMLTDEVGRERRRRHRTMFFDLDGIRNL